MKQLAFFVLIPVLGIVNAQQSHITSIGQLQQANGDSDTIWPKQITGSDIYFEYYIQGKDTVLRFTGKGGIWDKYCPQFNQYKSTVTYVEIGEGITPVGGLAACPRLKKVSLPNGLKQINKGAFEYDSNLQHVIFPEGLQSILTNAFGRTGLSDSLKFPVSLLFLGGNCFQYCPLTFVELPLKLDTLNGGVFAFCPFLSTVVFPANLSEIVTTSFYWDTLLQHIVNLNITPQIIVEKPSVKAFHGLDRSKCRLIVPTASVELYKSTPVWKDFMIEAGGISVGVCFNDKYKGNVYGLENRFYKKGEKVTLRAEPYNGCTFSGWKCNGQLLSTANPLSFTVTKDTMIQACFDGEVAVREPLKPVSASVTIYPNPTGDMFSVRSESQVEEIVVSDLSGRVLLRTERTSHADVSALPQGLYLVRVRTEKGSCVRKLVRR